MSIFGTPLARITTSDLQELVQEVAVENARLEFKLLIPTKDETLKKLSSEHLRRFHGRRREGE
jgi:hypothetical protein